MKGFDSEFRDLTDYILKCTARIWEGRDIAALDWHYGDDLIVRTPAGISHGNAAGKANTMATLTEFPDRQLFGEDVIWSGNDESGFLSSHRIISTATHHGGAFGAATGKSLTFRTIADTFCRENRVWDEWLIRDNSAIAIQLGNSAEQVARETLQRGDFTQPLTLKTDVKGPYTSKGNDDAWGVRHAELLQQIMASEYSGIKEHYDRACHLSVPGSNEIHGVDHATRFWLGLRSSFPTAKFEISHQMGREDELLPPRSAIRWSLTGNHDGWGHFGKPTGSEVHIMGVSHVEFGPRGVRRDTTLFDEIAIWKQILMQSEFKSVST